MSIGNTFGQPVAKGTESGAKGYVRNLITYDDDESIYPDTMEFWFRPAKVGEQLSPRYDSMTPMGMSHDYKTYASTGSPSYRFELFWNTLMILREIGQAKNQRRLSDGDPFKEGNSNTMTTISQMIEEDRRFLESLCFPSQGKSGLVGSSPPICLLVIPGIVTMRCQLTQLIFDFDMSDIRGDHKQLRAQTVWEERPIGRVTMEEQLISGSFRTWG